MSFREQVLFYRVKMSIEHYHYCQRDANKRHCRTTFRRHLKNDEHKRALLRQNFGANSIYKFERTSKGTVFLTIYSI